MISLLMAVHLPEGGCTATFAYRAVLVMKRRDVFGKDNLDIMSRYKAPSQAYC